MNDYTTTDYAEAEEYYATLSLKELRRYQALTQAQITLAHRQRKPLTLAHLERVDLMVAHAIYRKAFA